MVLYQGYFYATTMRCQTDLRFFGVVGGYVRVAMKLTWYKIGDFRYAADFQEYLRVKGSSLFINK